MLGGVKRRSLARSTFGVVMVSMLLVGTACTSTNKPVALSVTLSEFKVAGPATAPADRPIEFNVKNE